MPRLTGDELTNHRVGPHLDPGLFAFVGNVLRIAAQNRSHPDPDSLGQLHVSLERDPGTEAAAVPHFDIRPHQHPWSDFDPRANSGGAVDQSSGMNASGHLSTTPAIISASAATLPSTYATPFMRQVLPRNWSISTSIRNWSPGTTGRRNFTLSSDMK